MQVKICETSDINEMLRLRQELIRSVKNDNSITLDESFIARTKEYLSGDEGVSVIAYDAGKAVGCATLCYIKLIPTYDHPTGKRAHLMNVYVDKSYRRQGIAREMLSLIISQAEKNGVTGITLDATESGKPLYESLGFAFSDEHMELKIR